MATERVLTDIERARRNVGVGIAIVGLGLLGAFLAALYKAGGTNTPTTIIALGLAAFAFLGFWLALRRKVFLEVDRDARTYVLVQDGSRGPAQPLDALGPLSVSMRERKVTSGKTKRTITEYCVHPLAEGAHDRSLDIYVETTPTRARVRLERLARAWGLPSKAYNGDLRQAAELDMPLHERLRDDHDARRPAQFRPNWNLDVRPLSPGYLIVSRHRSWSPFGTALLIALPALVMFGLMMRDGIFAQVREGGLDLGDTVFLSLIGFMLVVLTITVARGAYNTFFPGTVKITPEGVSYRWSRIPLGEIEEIAEYLGVEVIGDRKTVRVPDFFCPLVARDDLAREIRARVIEMGPLVDASRRAGGS